MLMSSSAVCWVKGSTFHFLVEPGQTKVPIDETAHSIKLRATVNGDHLQVVSVSDEHNHENSEAAFKYYPTQSRLDAPSKQHVKEILKVEANHKLIQ